MRSNNQKLFRFIFGAIIFLSLLLRFVPARDNNFYFTMDQGNDAVWVREFLARHQMLWRGPETGINGLYTGPFWFWFISLGYALFAGHPFGAVFMLITLNVLLVGILMWRLAKKVSPGVALIVGFFLQFFWWFYDTSRYGFNPFPLVFLAMVQILLLTDFLAGKNKSFLLAAIPVGLAFHTEIAGGLALLLLQLVVGSWGLVRHHLSGKTFIKAFLILLLFFFPHLVSEVTTDFSQTQALRKQLLVSEGVFAGPNFKTISGKFLEIVTNSAVPQKPKLSLVLWGIIAGVFIFKLKRAAVSPFTSRFVILTLMLFSLSWLWFSSNQGWRPWHTIYLPPLLFVSLLLMTLSLLKKLGLPLLVLIFLAQMLFFGQRYQKFFRPSDDPSLLANELKAIDWVYQKSEGNGFDVYSYLPSVYDYPYQYLFWWYGRKKYGYLPCEYTTFPDTPDFFVPGLKYYQTPKKECLPLRFLIIEPDENLFVQDQWLQEVQKGTRLLKKANIGRLRLEKRSSDY